MTLYFEIPEDMHAQNMYYRGTARYEVLRILEPVSPWGMKLADIAERARKPDGSNFSKIVIRDACADMARCGYIRRIKHGLYGLKYARVHPNFAVGYAFMR